MYSCVFWCEFIDLVVFFFFIRGHKVTGCVLKITLVGFRWVEGPYIWRINLLSFILPCCSRFKLFSSDFETGEAGVFVFRCQVTHSGILRLGLPFLELKYKGWSIFKRKYVARVRRSQCSIPVKIVFFRLTSPW